MNTLDTAMHWLDMGIAPIPVKHMSKIPAVNWRQWQDHVPNPVVVKEWFGKSYGYNMGLVCGGKRNLSVIDFDDIAGYNEWMEKNIELEFARKTYRVKTSRGMHLYLYTRQIEKSRKLVSDKIDIRCSGNIVVAPPSVHPSGKSYEAVGFPEEIYTVDSTEDFFPSEVVVTNICTQKNVESDSSLLKMIKERVSILEFVYTYTRSIYKSSPDGRWWMAKCIAPNHNDHHPSFRIDTRGNRAKCMSPGCILYHDIGLDIFDLYSKMNNTSMRVAVNDIVNMFI